MNDILNFRRNTYFALFRFLYVIVYKLHVVVDVVGDVVGRQLTTKRRHQFSTHSALVVEVGNPHLQN